MKRLNRDIIAAFSTVLGELKYASRDWTFVIDVLSSILNEAPERRLCKNLDGTTRSPLQVMTAIYSRRTVMQVIPEREKITAPYNLDQVNAERFINIEKIQDELHMIHKDVELRGAERPKRAIVTRNAATKSIFPIFAVRDFVVVCKVTRPKHKLFFCRGRASGSHNSAKSSNLCGRRYAYARK